jgi:hypothetical protein
MVLDVDHIRYFPSVRRDGCRCENRLERGVPYSVEILTGFVGPSNYFLVSDVCGTTEIGADDKSQGIGRLIFKTRIYVEESL